MHHRYAIILIFTISSTYFETAGSSSGRRLHVYAGYNLFHANGISRLVDGRVVTLCTTRFNIQQDMQCTCNAKVRRFRVTINCCGKAMSIAYSEYVFVALVIQHIERMRRIIFSSVTCPALPYFFQNFS